MHRKQLGVSHSIVQITIAAFVFGEALFLLPLALAEFWGWVLLSLWLAFNFLVIPFIIHPVHALQIIHETTQR